MNSSLDNKKVVISLLVVLSVAVIFGAYFLSIKPMQTSLALKQNELRMNEQLLETISGNEESDNNLDMKNVVYLQQKLPVKPLTEQIVLEVAKAETISNSFVKSIEVSEEGEPTGTGDTSAKVTPEAAPQNQETKAQGTEGENSSSIPSVPGMQEIILTLEIESNNYLELEKFIQTLEKSKRVIAVDTIEYTGPAEIKDLSHKGMSTIPYKLIISAFYMPDLLELQKSLPTYKYPPPASKRDPFTMFSDEFSKDEQE